MAILRFQVAHGVGEEDEIGVRCSYLRAAEHQYAKLEPAIHIGKDALAILEIVQFDQRLGRHQFVEELAGGVVGGDAGRDEQAGASAGGEQLVSQLGEEHVSVDVAARRQREAAASANVRQGAVGDIFGRDIAGEQFGIVFLQFGDRVAAASGADGVGDARRGEGEELAFLEFEPFPGRIADDAVEAAVGPMEDGGESGWPIERLGMDVAIGDETVTLDDVMGQVGQGSAVAGGAYP